MAKTIKPQVIMRNKALAVNPLKVSQPVGASLAFLRISRAIPNDAWFARLHGLRQTVYRATFPRTDSTPVHGDGPAASVMGADEDVVPGRAVVALGKLVAWPTHRCSTFECGDRRRLY